jgi:hypothetical protein
MIVNICSSGSAGSTLLAHILNRHSKIYCGSEMALFSKPILYEDYNFFLQNIETFKKYGFRQNPYFNATSTIRNLDKNQINENIWEILSKSENLKEFIYTFKNLLHTKYKFDIWAEKTPENIYLIKYFIKAFPESKIIHIVRDARDVIDSLIKRGHSLESAADVWLSSIASIQPFVNNKNVYEVKYENLVLNPKDEIKKIFNFLNIEYEDEVLKPKLATNRDNNYFNSWTYKPTDEIKSDAIEKYKNSSIDFSKIFSMKITKEFANLQSTKEYYLIELLKYYKYDISDINFEYYIKKKKRKKIDNPKYIARVEL